VQAHWLPFRAGRADSLHPLRGDLSYANFFEKEDLKGQDLKGITFVGAELSGCDLREADLREMDLSHANMYHVRLEGADLRGANVEGPDLSTLGLRGVRLDIGRAVALAHSLGPSVYFDI
jgi:fluoroquinolone resistance protein